MMKNLADALSLNRNAVAKYMDILFQQGKVDIHYMGKAKVITVSKRAPFSLLAELSSDYIVGINRNLNCIDANSRFYAWAGITPEEISGKRIDNLPVPVFQHSQIMDLARNGISSVCDPVRITCSSQQGNGIYEIQCRPVVFGDGTTGCALIIRDITERETAQSRIFLLEERYRALVGTQSEYIVHLQPDGTITYTNPAFAEFVNITAGQLVGKKYKPKIPDEDIEFVKKCFHSFTHEEPQQCIEHRIINHSGKTRWLLWKVRCIFENGTPVEYHALGTDITELKTARDQIRFYQENYKKIVQEKTDDLQKINHDLRIEIQKRKSIEQNLYKTQFSVNNSSDLILWTDKDGTIASLNKSALNTLGLLPGSIPQFLRPETSGLQKPIPWEEIWRTVKQEGYILFEAIMPDKANNPLHVEVLGNYLYYYDSECCCLFARDITNRKKAEEALRMNEERFRNLIQNASDMIFIIDKNGLITYGSPSVMRITGYDPSKMTGKSSFILVHPDDRNLVEAAMGDILDRTNHGVPTEFRMRCASGTYIDVEAIATNQLGVPGITGIVATLRDITERKLAQRALLESEELFATAFYHSPLVMSISDIDTGQFVDVNHRFTSISGYSKEEVIGKTSVDVGWISKKDRDSFQMELTRDGKIGGLELMLTKKDGNTFWCSYYGEIINVAGKLQLLSLIEDIHERKLEEEATRRINKKLKLFSGITRHDINNQLTVLKGNFNLLKKEHPEIIPSNYFKKIDITAKRIAWTIQFTKEYDEISAMTPAWQNVRTIVTVAASQVTLGNVILNNELPDETAIFSDQLIFKAFFYLIDNAVRYGTKITFLRFCVAESGDNLVILCEDDGIGIPLDEKETIFLQGFGKNTGLGLYYSREILNINGIAIKETGSEGTGARFEMTVPAGLYRVPRS
nr:PAS domain S-box protein [uncultured Methanoregula sp.]